MSPSRRTPRRRSCIPDSTVRPPSSECRTDRRAAAAAIFTDPRNGRLPRTLVNRIWQRLLGPRDGRRTRTKWMASRGARELLDWLASDFVKSGYDLKHCSATILRFAHLPDARGARGRRGGEAVTCSRARKSAQDDRRAVRRSVGSITGEWPVYAARRGIRRNRRAGLEPRPGDLSCGNGGSPAAA